MEHNPEIDYLIEKHVIRPMREVMKCFLSDNSFAEKHPEKFGKWEVPDEIRSQPLLPKDCFEVNPTEIEQDNK